MSNASLEQAGDVHFWVEQTLKSCCGLSAGPGTRLPEGEQQDLLLREFLVPKQTCCCSTLQQGTLRVSLEKFQVDVILEMRALYFPGL
jgi:hypothetical protein